MKESISRNAKIIKACIHAMAANRLIGPQIQTGRLQRKMLEPAWKCPEEYRFLKIEMRHFSVECLNPKAAESDRVLLQIHGGGYVSGLRNIYRDFALEYSQMCGGMKVFSLDYRLAPKHPFPSAFLDATVTYQWLLDLGYDGKQIILAGDSAGGGLALALAMWLRDQEMPMPAGMVLMSPWTDQTASGVSYQENFEKDPMFGGTKESMIYLGEYRAGHDPKDPYLSPLFGDFRGLPPMLVQAGEIEMLRSDAQDAAAKAEKAGCQVTLSIYEGMFHVFQMALQRMPESVEAWEEIRLFLEALE